MSERIIFEQPPESQHVKKEKEKLRMVDADIEAIDLAIKSSDHEELLRVHKEIDGKYQECISGWGKSLYAYHPEHGIIYDNLDKESLIDNLTVMRPKLIAYKMGMNAAKVTDNRSATDVNVTVNNNVSVAISFTEARQRIEDMPGLTQEETDDIIDKINELESVSKEKISKKRKWEKVKPILSFVLDKSVDVAIMVFNLFLQMNL